MKFDYVYAMKTEDGTDIKLTMNDMMNIHNEYRFLIKCEYILENYPESVDKVCEITRRAIALEDNYGYPEDDAIEQAYDEIM